MARDAMTARCRACRTRNHPLRWRTLFDCWYCPRCETVRIRVIVDELITELTP
jgi:Zn finger protein HypA/HybF involved in hydrogenase expression